MMTFTKKKLSTAIALQWMVVLPAVAQVEEMVVSASPIRDSEMAAIDAKRNANNYVDIISADTIGRFPDQNLADSLGRMPGLAIERDQGQARYINLRGAPFRYTTIAFDGLNVPGAEGGRVPRFDSFPSVITSRLEANKAVLPSMPGDTVAGFINIHTFNPFDQEGLTFASDIGTGQQQLGGGDVRKYSLRSSWSNERFGAVVFASENKREQITDNREYDLEIADNGELQVNSLDFRSYEVERRDSAWGGRVEYRGDAFTVFASTLYSEFTDFETRHQYVFNVSSPAPGAVRAGVPVTVDRLLQNGEYETSTQTSTLGFDFTLSGWEMEARVNRTETSNLLDLPIPQSMNAQAVADINLSGNLQDPQILLDRPLSSLEFPMNLAIYVVSNLDVTTDKFKFDASRDISLFGHPTRFQTGLQLDTRKGSGVVTALEAGGFPSSVNIGDFRGNRPWDSNKTNWIGGTYYDNAGLEAAWAAAGGLQAPAVAPENRIIIEEDILAAYAMVTTEFDWGNLILGARYEYTDYLSQGTGVNGPVSVDDDFSHLLPSAHLNINLAENLKWRISASTGISRPTYNEWRAAASVNISDQRISGGNPRLKPEEAIGLDTSLEWYFAPASILSAGAFHRRIDNVIYADTSLIDPGIFVPESAGERWLYSGSVNGSDGRLSGVELNLVGHARDWLPSYFDGLGLTANVTFLDSEFSGIDGVKYGLPGTSDRIFNSSLFYEKYGLSLRLSYQHRTEWISPLEDPSEVWGDQQRVDFSAIYTLPMDLSGMAVSLYANVNNLSNETDDRFAGNGTINQSESFGRHWVMGFRLNY